MNFQGMKKYIYNLAVLALGLVAATSCSPDFVGTEPGNDSTPKTVLFTYTPTSADGNYDADTDVRLRITGNAKTEQVYYKAVKTASIEGQSDDQIISDVISTGTSVNKPGAGVDVFVTGMQGDYTICGVAVNGNSKVLTKTTFFGLTWTDVCTGTVRCKYADLATNTYAKISDVVLQHNEDNPENYRLKNPFGTGVNVMLVVTKSHEEYDATGMACEGENDYFGNTNPYYYISSPKASMGFSVEGADAALGDYMTVRGNADYYYYNRLYTDGEVHFYSNWVVGGNKTGWFDFYPNN